MSSTDFNHFKKCILQKHFISLSVFTHSSTSHFIFYVHVSVSDVNCELIERRAVTFLGFVVLKIYLLVLNPK